MKRYKNLGGNSSITHYKIGSDFIEVKFKAHLIYVYSHRSAGKKNIDQMKVLAEKGQGLCSFINTTVRSNYESKREK